MLFPFRELFKGKSQHQVLSLLEIYPAGLVLPFSLDTEVPHNVSPWEEI